MQKGLKSTKSLQSKTVKLDSKTHKSLRMYAVQNDFTLGEAVRSLLDKTAKK
jgi:hypothetical protein